MQLRTLFLLPEDVRLQEALSVFSSSPIMVQCVDRVPLKRHETDWTLHRRYIESYRSTTIPNARIRLNSFTLFFKRTSNFGAEAERYFLRFEPENVLNMFLKYRLSSTTN